MASPSIILNTQKNTQKNIFLDKILQYSENRFESMTMSLPKMRIFRGNILSRIYFFLKDNRVISKKESKPSNRFS